ncbi:MAG: YfiR family protein [Zoogloeaceae bacterium]|jgi:hypothetical protein|nr:YfiR family protein [Zoogloeaceae bacterium]
MLLFIACLPVSTNAQTPTENGASRASMVLSIVAGIINYTRWPHLGGSLRVCIAGESEHSNHLRGNASSIQTTIGMPVSFQAIQSPENVVAQCNALYVGQTQEAKRFLEHATGQPILSIGEGKELCSMGSMFCLDLSAPGSEVRFAANLDAISRSTVRVNPQVLRLTSRLSRKAP